MARGLLMGTVSGLAFAAMVLAVASLLAPQPAGNRPPEAPATDLAAAPGPVEAPEAAQPAAADQVVALPGDSVAAPAAPPVAAEGALPLADTSPAAVPEISRGDALAAAPEAASAPAAIAGADAPVVQPGQGPAPQPPAADALALSTEPAARPAPLEPALEAPAESAAAPEMPAMTEAAPPAAAAPAPDAAAGDAPAAPDTGSADLPAVTDEAALPAATGADSIALAPAADLPGPDLPGPDLPAPDLPAPDAPVPDALPPAGADAAAPDTSAVPAATDDAPALPGGDTGIRVNRPADEAAAPADDPAPVAADDAPARVRYAAAFADPGGLPYLSIVVIDDGALQPGPAILSSVPFPVTVALDPARADAAAVMADYRAAGIEVAALADLPEGAGATDVSVNLQATFAALPETVALIDPGTGGLAEDPDLAAAALTRLAGDGRGFVWMAGGLDQLSALSGEAGVPGVAILRDLDGTDQDAATIRRFIDNAAFQARRDGSVVLLARLRPETVSALTLWGTANRARQVAMAPLSAVLNGL